MEYPLILTRSHLQRELSEREAECLFYLLRGATAREVGKMLHLSPRTVEGYIEELKWAFDCSSKSELLEKATGEGV